MRCDHSSLLGGKHVAVSNPVRTAFAVGAGIEPLVAQPLEEILDPGASIPDDRRSTSIARTDDLEEVSHFLKLGAIRLTRQADNALAQIRNTRQFLDDLLEGRAMDFRVERGQHEGDRPLLSVPNQFALEASQIRLAEAVQGAESEYLEEK